MAAGDWDNTDDIPTPHVVVKLWPGKSDQQKKKLADEITQAVMKILHYGDDSVSVGFEEIAAKDWTELVYKPDIFAKPGTIFKKPGYSPLRAQPLNRMYERMK